MSRRLVDLRHGLLDLHKTLIDSERVTYEGAFGKVESKGAFLQLLIQDPWFAWLRPLSQLIALIDETLEADQPVTADDAKGLVKQARALLKPSDAFAAFAEHYSAAIQRDPDVVLAVGEISKLLDAG